VPARWSELCLLVLWMAVSSSSAAAQDQASSASSASASPQAFPMTSDEVIGHVRRVLDWYHHISQVAQLPGAAEQPVARDRLEGQALTAVGLAFDLGKAAAPLVASPPGKRPGEEASVVGQLREVTKNLDQRAAEAEKQLDEVNAELKRAKGATRKTLRSRRDNLVASLELMRASQASVQQMLEFASRAPAAGGEAPAGLTEQLTELQRSVQAHTGAAAARGPSAVPAAVPTSTTVRPESAGIIALVTQTFALRGTRSQMTSLRKETDALLEELERLRTALVSQVREIMRASVTASEQSPQEIAAQKQVIEAGTARFKALSSVLVPLREQSVALTNARTTLGEWSKGVDARLLSVTRYFALRVGVLLASVLAVLGTSELWRRATLHYVRDPARRRPLLVLRRLVIAFLLVVVVAFGLVSEVGSLATFMGFLTAGIAVTLQNVILSVVAYFFLIGRHGVQVGDRITLAGVTGRVVDVSLMRLYLLELAGTDLHTSGRLVVLSNAVLFQPAALYKQIPGANYLWHTLTLTVAPGADIEEASRRLETGAASVFHQYRGVIEKQHALMEAHIDFEAGLPGPQVRVEAAEDGLRCSVRYPVVAEHAAAIDQQMLEALRKSLEQDGQMKLLSAGAVKLTWDS
jgi:small-conductance mechanosensitive channel